MPSAKTDRKQKKEHLFKPGKSGNPKGRPVGSRHKVSLLMDVMLTDQAEALLEKAIKEALNGDSQTLRALIDKLLPNARERPVNVKLPAITATGDIPKITAALLKAVAEGHLTPSEAASIGRIVENHRAAVELTDIETRLTEIERKFNENNNNKAIGSR